MRLISPLRRRDFALLFTGGVVSLIGDGIYIVAIAFQVLALTDSPTTLSLVLLAWSAGLVSCLPFSGVLIDRVDRRAVMIGADALQLVAVAALGVLSVTGAIEIWHCAVFAGLVGAGTAFVKPASSALMPAVVPQDELLAATALHESAHQGATLFIGPAIGGLMVAGGGPGGAFLADAVTFAISIASVASIRTPARPERDRHEPFLVEIRTALAYVRGEPWLWATLAAASFAVFAFVGPLDVLLPYVVKNEWSGGAEGYGFLLAVSGVAGMLISLALGQRGLPKRPVLAMFGVWGFSGLALCGFGLVGSVPAAVPFAVILGLGFAGEVIWFSLVRTRVPDELLGRVSSLDWFVSMALLPISFAVCGPAAEAFGTRPTLIGAGLIVSAAFLVLYLAVPGLREDDERSVARAAASARPS